MAALVNHFLRIPAEVSQLAVARQFIAQVSADLGLPSSVCDPLTLAVDESLSNIILHGYRGQAGLIEIETEQVADAVLVHLRDQAPPFDPTRLPDPDIRLPLHDRPVGGMGVYLARRSVDKIAYERLPDGGNHLTLTKKTALASI
jgi:serine/threonine-protein kinase RsbW